jgi:hypothetical protein
MFAGELFCFPQLLEGLVNVIHGGSSVPTPIAASMFQIVPGTLECPLCGLNFGGHVPLRGSWEEVRGGGYDHKRKDYEGSNSHGSSSGENVGSTARESATLPTGMAIQVFAESQMRQPRALAWEILQCEPILGRLDKAVGLELGSNAFGDKSPKALAARWLLRDGWTLVAIFQFARANGQVYLPGTVGARKGEAGVQILHFLPTPQAPPGLGRAQRHFVEKRFDGAAKRLVDFELVRD